MCKKLFFISLISLLVLISSASAAPLISDADLVVYYDFDSVGATVADGSGNGNDANVVGDVKGYNLGRRAGDVVFGGDVAATDLLRFSAAEADRPSTAVTVAAWCKVSNEQQDMSVFNVNGVREGDPTATANIYHMEIHPKDTQEYLRWTVRNQAQGTIGNFNYYPPDGIPTDEWFHFACTYDKNATDANNLKMYVNGVYVAGMPADTSLADLNIGTGWEYGAALGCTANNARPYDGEMDEYYLFKRALTPAEISKLASASWLVNGDFETGDLTGWFPWNNSDSEVIAAPNSIGDGDYSAQVTCVSGSSGLAQIVAVPKGTLVKLDLLWAGNLGGSYWAEVKLLTHEPGASYNLDESYGDWKYVAKSDAWGLNQQPGDSWDWVDAATAFPMDGDTILSQGEVIVATKIGGTQGNTIAIDNAALVPLYSVVKADTPIPGDTGSLMVEDFDEVLLSWEAGSLAGSHDVYFGDNFDAVTDATRSSAEFMGNQVGLSYAPTITAEGMYYWRIDEVNDTDVWQGDVWSFYVSLLPPPKIDDPIVWYPFDDGSGSVAADISGNGNDANLSATNKWDDEGFDGSGCLNNNSAWSSFHGIVPAAAFTDVNEAATVSFWFNNGEDTFNNDRYQWGGFCAGSKVVGESLKQVIRIHLYDDDGYDGVFEDSNHYIVSNFGADESGSNPTDWWYGYNNVIAKQLGQWHHIAVAKDCETLTHKIYFDGLQVRDIPCEADMKMNDVSKFKIFSKTASDSPAWWDTYKGKMDDFRIYDRALTAADMELFVGDRFKPAWYPYPEDEAQDFALDALTLSWEAGQKAVSHRIYFGTDRVEVKNADVGSACYQGEQTGTTLAVGALELSKTYYWRVDEVDDESIVWKGDIWSFSTIPSIMVEDFESYDNDGNDIGAVWAENGQYEDMRIALYDEPNLSPVNSMRLMYYVPEDPYYAIAHRYFSPAQDWTVNGVKILTIHYHGDAANMGLPAFVTIGDGTTDANVVVDVNAVSEQWNQINVSLPEIAAAGVDIANVSYIEIGFGDGTDQGMSKRDVLYIDDIALYPSKCVLSESGLLADATGDCVVNYDDLDLITLNWLLNGYTVSAAPVNDDDLILHYDFEDNVVDSVAGNNGTLQDLGSAATYEAGHNGGKCIHFNATATDSGSNMIVPAAAFASLDDEVTFSFWLKKDEAAPSWYQALFAGHGLAVNHREIFMAYAPAREGNMVTMFTGGSDGPIRWSSEESVSFVEDQPFDYTAWNHYAMVKNAKVGYMYLYVNGELKAFKTDRFKPITDCDKFVLGGYTAIDSDDDSGFAKASFDDFRMYNRALSHAEVLTLAGQTTATVPLSVFDDAQDVDFNADDAVDFADYSILANEWLVEDLWP